MLFLSNEMLKLCHLSFLVLRDAGACCKEFFFCQLLPYLKTVAYKKRNNMAGRYIVACVTGSAFQYSA